MTRPSESTSGVLYHSQWMVRAAARHVGERGLVAFAGVDELAAHRLDVLALGLRPQQRRRPSCPSRPRRGKPKIASAAGFHAVMRSLAVPLEHGERRALEVHAQLLRGELLALLRLASSRVVSSASASFASCNRERSLSSSVERDSRARRVVSDSTSAGARAHARTAGSRRGSGSIPRGTSGCGRPTCRASRRAAPGRTPP